MDITSAYGGGGSCFVGTVDKLEVREAEGRAARVVDGISPEDGACLRTLSRFFL